MTIDGKRESLGEVPMIYRDQLEAVYRLIEKPEHWTQFWLAKNSAGHAVPPNDDSAICWCVIGAFQKCGLVDPEQPMWKSVTRILMPEVEVEKLDACSLPGGIADFNDTHTHAEVLELLRSAIERAPVRP